MDGQGSPLSRDFTLFAETMDEIIGSVEHDLRGEYLKNNSEGKPVWESSGEKIMNEKGIRYIISMLRIVANKNTFLSGFEQNEKSNINHILGDYLQTISDNLLFNAREYELNPRYFDSVVEKCAIIAEMALRRAYRGAEKEFLTKSMDEHRIVDNREENTGGSGLFGTGLFGRGK